MLKNVLKSSRRRRDLKQDSALLESLLSQSVRQTEQSLPPNGIAEEGSLDVSCKSVRSDSCSHFLVGRYAQLIKFLL